MGSTLLELDGSFHGSSGFSHASSGIFQALDDIIGSSGSFCGDLHLELPQKLPKSYIYFQRLPPTSIDFHLLPQRFLQLLPMFHFFLEVDKIFLGSSGGLHGIV